MRTIIFEKLQKLNWNLILIFCLLFFVGITMLYSAGGGNMMPWAKRQLIYFLIFFPSVFIIALIDINFWFKTSYLMYFGGVGLLFLVEIIGHKSMGATRWINFGFFRLQPSEIMKIALIVGLAKYFFRRDLDEIRQTKYLIVPLIMFAIPFFLILNQPNLGTALILFFITGIIFFCSGVQIWKFIFCLVCVLIASPIIWKYGIKDYQKQRVMTFLHPDKDLLKSGYNIMQSKIAIGSGGIRGKGLLKGTQGQLEFLPEKQTDFIFTTLCEEFGFIGALTVIFLFCSIFGYLVYISTKCHHTYGRIIVLGILSNLFFHFFINIGMISGILPVVGTPLPLLSYGGSITATSLISLGFILNVDLHKTTIIKDNKNNLIF